MNDNTSKVVPLPVTTSHAYPTAMLRWRRGVLEQLHVVDVIEGGRVVDRDQEWREVPTEDEP